MSECAECGGVGGYWTEWGDGDKDPEVEALLIEAPSADSGGLAYIRCHVCGPLLMRVANLNTLATIHDEVKMVLGGVCRRYGATGIGDLATRFPDEFDLLEQALTNMVAELPHTRGLR